MQPFSPFFTLCFCVESVSLSLNRFTKGSHLSLTNESHIDLQQQTRAQNKSRWISWCSSFFYFYKVSRFPNPSGFLPLAESTSLLLCFILSAVSNNFLRFLACLVALPKAEGVMSVVFRPAPSSEAESH